MGAKERTFTRLICRSLFDSSQIHRFGGDPNRVTIWGESAGKVDFSVSYVIHQAPKRRRFRDDASHCTWRKYKALPL